MEPGRLPEVPNWFPGARLNYAENLLYRKDDGIALTEAGESGVVTNITFRELNERVRVMASALRVNGLKVGDRVAGKYFAKYFLGWNISLNSSILGTSAIVTNAANAVVIALATASIGGIFSSTATDMGTQVGIPYIILKANNSNPQNQGILDRYRQIRPKFVFAETEIFYAGKAVDLLPKVAEVVHDLAIQGLQRAILLPSRVSGREMLISDMSRRYVILNYFRMLFLLMNALSATLAEFLRTGDNRPLEFEQLPFGQPLYILYSSGTSGKPKCIVHSAGVRISSHLPGFYPFHIYLLPGCPH